jgi:light-regulated signal transduction histidine kinase (bacteriophytochrome)
MLSSAFNKMAHNLHNEILARGREITERKNTEQKLAVLNKQLEATVENLSSANRELAEVAYIAAHDLKTPTRAVGSLASMMLSDYKDTLNKDAKNELNMIVSKAEKMNELLDGMLEYCRLQRVISNSMLVDTNKVVQRVIAQVSPPPNVEIIIDNKLPIVECEYKHIELLFYHLITNAVKFIDKPKGVVRIACTEKNSFWRFSVADNGCGIERKYFQRIFKLFQKLDSNDKVPGAGIGLAMVKKIVELYQGAVWIDSQPRVGSTFFFALPMNQSCVDLSDKKRRALTTA